ncbi:hypothetical protein [uncultured Nocardioides sp.]|nr:hypothetical protein [uncultured Nocardioides sp.]
MADMLETRLREALEFGSAVGASGTDLATAARTRAAARRRHRVLGLGVAVVLAAGLGVATLVDGGSPPDEAPPASGEWPRTSGELDPPAGWHVEQWRGVSIHVPNTWDAGALSAWCERGPLLGVPVVERPGEPASAPCSDPAVGYGVQFLGPRRGHDLESHAVRQPRRSEAATYPRDAWVGVTCADCDVAIRVVAPTPYVAHYLLGTYARTSPSS